MAEQLALFALFLAAAWFIFHVMRGYKGASNQRQSQPVQQVDSTASAPESYLARWRVSYLDAEGATTKRVIRVIQVRPRLRRLEVWCELRNDKRTLSLWGLQDVVDAQTGDPVDLLSWLEAYNKSRRRK